MRRIFGAALIVAIAVGFTMTLDVALGEGQKPTQQAKGKGGGNGGGGDGGADPNYVLQLTIHDSHPGAQLLSDEQERQDPNAQDADMDSFGDLTFLPGMGSYFYLDNQAELKDGDGALIGPYADPCSDFNLSTESSPGRARLSFSQRLADSSRCALSTNPDYTNDARTISLVFDKGDAADINSGGSCACAKLAYLANPDGSPATMYGGELARTSFSDSDPGDPLSGTCTLGLAAGALVWPDGSGNLFSDTSIPRIEAWPYEDLHASKKGQRKAGQSIDFKTDVRFDFYTDVKELGDQNRWELNSQGEIVPTSNPDSPADNDVREITASGQAFDLTGPEHLFPGGGQCSDVSMTFKLTVKRVDLNAGQ